MQPQALLLLAAGLTASTIAAAESAASDVEEACRQNLETLGHAVERYARVHRALPASLSRLYADGQIPELGVFVCPASDTYLGSAEGIDELSDFRLVEPSDSSPMMLLRERRAPHAGHYLAFFSDRSIRKLPDADAIAAQKLDSEIAALLETSDMVALSVLFGGVPQELRDSLEAIAEVQKTAAQWVRLQGQADGLAVALGKQDAGAATASLAAFVEKRAQGPLGESERDAIRQRHRDETHAYLRHLESLVTTTKQWPEDPERSAYPEAAKSILSGLEARYDEAMQSRHDPTLVLLDAALVEAWTTGRPTLSGDAALLAGTGERVLAAFEAGGAGDRAGAREGTPLGPPFLTQPPDAPSVAAGQVIELLTEPRASGTIRIAAATLGADCGGGEGNVTWPLSEQCDGKEQCEIVLAELRREHGRKDSSCQAALEVVWQCASAPHSHQVTVGKDATANGVLRVVCGDKPVSFITDPIVLAQLPEPETINDAAAIRVTSATYGANCGAPEGNATSAVAAACDGKRRCEYVVDYRVLGDPSVGCGKTFVTVWQCGEDPRLQRHEVPAEAGYRGVARLECAKPQDGAESTVAGPAAVGWVLLETIAIPADRAEKFTTQTVLAAGETYRLVARGTFSAWGGEPVGIDAVWCDLPGRCTPPQPWQQLRIDGKGINEMLQAQGQAPLDYEASHVYGVRLEGAGNPLTLHLWDAVEVGSAAGNTGAIVVEIHGRGAPATPTAPLVKRPGGPDSQQDTTTPAQDRLQAEEISLVQALLTELGYDPGRTDGTTDEPTREAVRAFQGDVGATVDGALSAALIDQLLAALDSGSIIVEGPKDSPPPEGRTISEEAQAVLAAHGIETVDGVLIVSLKPHSIARTYGLEAGDIVVAVNNAPISTSLDLVEVLRWLQPAEAFRVRIWRDGAERTLDLVAPGSIDGGGPGPKAISGK